MYDAPQAAQARWLLNAKVPLVNDNTTSALWTALNVSAPYNTGTPGRWALADAPNLQTQWNDVADTMSAAREMTQLWTIYSLLQSLVLIGLLSRYGACTDR